MYFYSYRILFASIALICLILPSIASDHQGCNVLITTEEGQVLESTIECIHGECVDGEKCKCYSYYAGDTCDQLFQSYMGIYYDVYFYIMCITWTLLSVWVSIRFYFYVKATQSFNSKYAIHILLLSGCLLRYPFIIFA